MEIVTHTAEIERLNTKLEELNTALDLECTEGGLEILLEIQKVKEQIEAIHKKMQDMVNQLGQ